MIEKMIRGFKEYLENRDLRFDENIKKDYLTEKDGRKLYFINIKFYEEGISFKDCSKLNQIAELFKYEVYTIKTRFELPNEDCFVTVCLRPKY